MRTIMEGTRRCRDGGTIMGEAKSGTLERRMVENLARNLCRM
ncbi:MAG: hypothetical protein WBM17_17480 [Anaerolineales bacterium]